MPAKRLTRPRPVKATSFGPVFLGSGLYRSGWGGWLLRPRAEMFAQEGFSFFQHANAGLCRG